jgi:peptidoglycan/LPS O-acetylase OafA/YrhL
MTNLPAISAPIFFAISGASLLYANPISDKKTVRVFYVKRILNIYPIFYIAFVYATAFSFFIQKGLPSDVPAWHMVFSIVGFDGLLSVIGIPTFYQVGEWFLGCIIYLYALFPFLRFMMRKSVYLLMGFGIVVIVIGFFAVGHSQIQNFIIMPLVTFIFGMLAIGIKPKYSIGAIVIALMGLLSMLKPDMNFWLATTILGCGVAYVIGCVGSLVCNVQWISKITVWFSNLGFSVILTHHVIIAYMLHYYNPIGDPMRDKLAYIVLLGAIILVASTALKKSERIVKRYLPKCILNAASKK